MAYAQMDSGAIRSLCGGIFESYGFGAEDAAAIADVLLTADLFGIESHGVQRMIRYHHAMRDGEVDVRALLEILHETPVSATVDAHRAMGQLAGIRAMEMAIGKAKATGIGMVAVRRSNHYGIAGYYALMAARQDLIGVCMTNTEAIMVPTFGRQAMLGTNPIAVSMPAEPEPFLFDAATTVVPRGKLEVYNKNGSPIPIGWAVDELGRDTASSDDVLRNIIEKRGGGILPLGGSGETTSGYKGYGFGLICELFTAIMAGGATSNHAVDMSIGKNELSHCFWAVDYGVFGEKQAIKENFTALLKELRDSDKAEGQGRIYVHGEKEQESMRHKLAEGIPVNEKTWAELRDIALDRGLDPVPYIGKSFGGREKS